MHRSLLLFILNLFLLKALLIEVWVSVLSIRLKPTTNGEIFTSPGVGILIQMQAYTVEYLYTIIGGGVVESPDTRLRVGTELSI